MCSPKPRMPRSIGAHDTVLIAPELRHITHEPLCMVDVPRDIALVLAHRDAALVSIDLRVGVERSRVARRAPRRPAQGRCTGAHRS